MGNMLVIQGSEGKTVIKNLADMLAVYPELMQKIEALKIFGEGIVGRARLNGLTREIAGYEITLVEALKIYDLVVVELNLTRDFGFTSLYARVWGQPFWKSYLK